MDLQNQSEQTLQDETNSTDFHSTELLPDPDVPQASIPDSRLKLKFILVGVWVVAIVFILAAVVLLMQPPATKIAAAPTATTPPAQTGIDLSYPGATKIQVDNKTIPANVLLNQTGVMQATDDSADKISEYYNKKLKELGFTLTPTNALLATVPNSPNVGKLILALKGQTQAIILITSVADLKTLYGNDTTGLEAITKQVKPNQNIILYSAIELATSSTAFGLVTRSSSGKNISPTPVSKDSVAYLGPDNKFHAESEIRLVSIATEKGETEDGKSSVEVNWVYSGTSQTKLLITVTGADYKKSFGEIHTNTTTITDEGGKTYKVNFRGGYGDDKGVVMSLEGTNLPETTRKITLDFDGNLKLLKPITIGLDTTKNAKLPIAIPLPNTVTESNGIKITAYYVYFGKDKTVLLLNLDKGQFLSTDTLAYITIPEPSVRGDAIFFDDKGTEIEVTPAEGSTELTNSTNIPITFVLKPLETTVKNLIFKTDKLTVRLSGRIFGNNGAVDTLKVPVAELLKSGTWQPGSTLNFKDGIKVEVVGYKATQVRGSSKVDLDIRYKVTAEKMSIANPEAFFYCTSCQKTNSLSSWTSLGDIYLKDSNPTTTEPDYYEISTSFEYDGTQPQIDLSLASLAFDLKGKWEFTIPVKP